MIPLIVEGDDLELLPLIEQELILSLPIVSYHSVIAVYKPVLVMETQLKLLKSLKNQTHLVCWPL